MNEPPSTSRRAVRLTTNWKKMNLCMLRYSERPHCTALTILVNESSMRVMSLAFFATLVPEPNESPTWAWLRAGASFVPSPVTATTSPCFCSRFTRRCLSVGLARLITFSLCTLWYASSSLNAAKSGPVICAPSGILSCQIPICLAISMAVADVSPVTIFTSMPALLHDLTAPGTSSRSGSLMAAIACKVSSLPHSLRLNDVTSLPISLYARARVRIACDWYP